MEQTNSVNKMGDSHENKDSDHELEEQLKAATILAEEGSEEEYLSAEDGDDDDSESELPDFIQEIDKPTEDKENNTNTTEKFDDGGEAGDEEPEQLTDIQIREKEEECLSDQEKEERQKEGQKLKDDGNAKFRIGEYDEATEIYSEALEICPLYFHKERAVMFANRAACKMKKELYQEAIVDSTSAIELHPQYLKAILRRAELYEKTEKLDEALKDYQAVVELDPSQHAARAACMKLSQQIQERNEKMKAEMMGQLKNLGNLVLRPFGLNVNNFNLQQDPNTGSYSVQFSQNQSGNGNGS